MRDGYNALSNKAHAQQMFEFDLQLFGGGGDGKGGALKIIGTIAFAAIGFYHPAMFGLTGGVSWGAAAMGASLFTSLWSAFSNRNKAGTYDYSNIQRFERSQETMSSDGQLPVVYGCRQVTGNQTYHKTNSDSTTLWKHVVLCEGGIDGIESVTANDLLIPTGTQTSNTVFTIQNVKYEDAYVSKSGRNLTLKHNGSSKTIYLCTSDDLTSGDTYWDYQVSVSSLISYINRMGEGWQAFPVASTNTYPGNLWDITTTNVYKNPANLSMDTVTGGTKYTLKDCVPPDNYEEVGAYTNMAWLDMVMTISSELNGNPSISCLIRGRKVYDVRTGITRYSTNPVLCVRDFILSKRYGLGKWFSEKDLDEDSWIEAADYCDELITFLDGSGAYVTAKRYELNMIIDTKRSALEWLQEMLANFCGYIVYSNGKIKMKIEKQTPVSYKFDDDTCKDLKISPLALSETPNRYEVTIIDPLNNWSTVKCLCDDYADQKQRQRIISKSVSLEGVTSQNQALRLARFYRDYNLVCPMQLSFTTGMQAMHLEPGDVVTISYHGVFKDMPIRISEIKETNRGTFEISGRQYNDTIYGDALGGGIHWYTYNTIATPYAGEVPDVTNLVAKAQSYVTNNGAMINTVKLTWDSLQYQFFSKYIVEYQIEGFNSWTQVSSTSDNSCMVNVNLDWTYTFRVRVENTAGRLSKGTVSEPIFISGYNEPPAAVQDISYTIVNGTINLKWKANDEPDIKGYNIYQGVGNVGFDSCELVVENNSANMVSIPITTAQDYTFYIVAVDTAGNTSISPTGCLVTIDPLSDVQNFYGVKNSDTIQFFWDAMENCNYEIRWGSSWDSGRTIAKINSNVYTLFFPLIGTQTFFIKAYNGNGLYSKNASWLSINCTPMTTRNIIAEFDESGNGWPGAKVAFENSGYDLILRRGVTTGEYYTMLNLNKEVEARNWIEYEALAVSDDVKWDDLDKQWDDTMAPWVTVADGSLLKCENYISTKTNEDYLYSFDLNKNTDGASKATGITYEDARFAKGVLVGEETTLEYEVEIPEVFNMSFNAKPKDITEDYIVFATLANADYWLRIEYHSKTFALMDSLGQRIELDNYFNENNCLTFVIKQTASSRTFKIINVTLDKTVEKTEAFVPLGSYTELRLRA